MNYTLFTIAWISYLIIHMITSAYLSYKTNLSPDKMWFYLTVLIGMIPVWAIVAKYSRNLSADGLLYDIIITLIYYPALLYFSGTLGNMQWYQWLGFALAAGGAFLVRL